MTWRVFSGQPALVGHRGLGAGVVDGRRENTVESFLAALDAGVAWVELDVQRTCDDVLVVAHDATVASGGYLAEMTGAEAARHGVARLDEVLEALPTSAGVVFDVESSLHDAGRPAASTTAALLARVCRRLTDRPTFAQSFDPAALRHIRQTAPATALGLLTWKRFPIGHAVAAAAHLDVQVLAAHAGSLWRGRSAGHDVPALETVVSRLHSAGRQLLVWCPSERRARALAAAGVDAMVVDEVPRQVRALSRVRVPRRPRVCQAEPR